MTAGLLLLFFGLLLKIIVPAMRYSAEGNIRVELQQQGILAMNRMVADLQLTVPQGVSLKTSVPAGMAINRIGGVGGGFPTYEGSVVVYHYDDTAQTLTWETDALASPTTSQPNSVTPTEIQTFVSTTSGDERILARNVTAFELTAQSPYQEAVPPATQPTPARPMTIRLAFTKDIPHTPKVARVELVRSVYLRNSL